MKAASGMVVSMHYTLTDDAGEVLDTIQGRGPFDYLHGHGNIIPGLESRLEGAEPGFKDKVTVAPADGYGERNDQAVFDVPRDQFPPDEEIRVGMQVHGEGPQGVIAFTVVDVAEDSIRLDGNHPLAGKTLHFDVEILDIRAASEEEIAHGHVHGPHGHHH